ncbi:MAG: lactate racemase domain-containing protein, partial [Anaerolineae bacterium]
MSKLEFDLIGKGSATEYLSDEDVRSLVLRALEQVELDGKRVLVIIPDSTRTVPLSLFFRSYHEALWGRVATLDYLVALGTHQPPSEESLNRLVGITEEERATAYAGVGLMNHRW